jgi:C-terminal processing protease CtpA/Prc
MEFLTESQRRTVLSNVLNTVNTKFMGAETAIEKLREEHEARVAQSASWEQFEEAMTQMLRQLGTSHTGFFYESRPRAAGRIAMAATLMKADTADGNRWVFQNVHPGGVAARAGIRAGDALLKIGDRGCRSTRGNPICPGRDVHVDDQAN